MKRILLLVTLGLVVSRPVVFARQTSLSFGQVTGAVTEPSGAVVPSAQILVTNDATGTERQLVTDGLGVYDVLLLPPGVYTLTAGKEGFQRQTVKSVRVTIGAIAIVNFQLQIGQQITVEVTDFVPMLETERSHQANTVTEELIDQLPISRRDYLTYTLLAPGVNDSKAIADASDFRVPQTRDTGLSFYGSNGRGNTISIDGGEVNSASGGVRETISQEAVQEFQINRANYSAEIGGGTGAAINIVSKSGTNQFRGSAFGFFRTSGLNAADPFAMEMIEGTAQRVKPPSETQQFGATVGGPLRIDRTFFFVAFEGLRRRESNSVQVLTDNSIFGTTPDQEKILATLPPDSASQLRAALTSSAATRELFEINSGVFGFRNDDYNSSVRIDHELNSANQLMFRYRYANISETNPNIRALVGVSRGYKVDALDHGGFLSWTHSFNPRTINQAHVQFDYRNFFVATNDAFGPELNINGYGFFNRDFALPSYSTTRNTQLYDSLTLNRGSHNFKLGGSILIRANRNEVHVYQGGRFSFGPLPGSLVSSALASTTITSLQAFNLGLPQFYQQGFGDPVVRSTIPAYAGYFQDSWKATSDLTINLGVRYDLDIRTEPIPRDANNWAPRIGFAWSPRSVTTVRGGYGIFYSPDYFQLDFVAKALSDLDGHRQIAQVFAGIQTPGPASAINIYRTLLAQGVISIPVPAQTITSTNIEQFGLRPSHDGPISPQSVLFSNAPDFVNPYSQQASIGVEHQVNRQFSIDASYVFVSTLKIMRARDQNLLPAPVDPTLGIRIWSPGFFKDPLLLQDNVYESSARAFYHGLMVQVAKRFSGRYSGGANYTFSKAIDDVVDFNTDFQANDQTNLRAERSLSAFDQRHKFTLFGTLVVPAPAAGAFRALLSDMQASTIVRAGSGRPFNLLVGSDINRDLHSTSDRPPFAGRNTGRGPNFSGVDLRLTKTVSISDRSRIEIIGEAFNVLNRLNFQSVNNTVGLMTGTFDVEGRRDASPSEPLGFTSAYEARRIQLGLKMTF